MKMKRSDYINISFYASIGYLMYSIILAKNIITESISLIISGLLMYYFIKLSVNYYTESSTSRSRLNG